MSNQKLRTTLLNLSKRDEDCKELFALYEADSQELLAQSLAAQMDKGTKNMAMFRAELSRYEKLTLLSYGLRVLTKYGYLNHVFKITAEISKLSNS